MCVLGWSPRFRRFVGSGAALDFVHPCLHDGWKTVTRANGTPFANLFACVVYRVRGGLLAQTITFTSTDPTPVNVAQTYAPTAIASSGLPVTITLDGSSRGCSLAGGVVTFNWPGTCVIDVNQAGNGIWAAAPQQQQTIVINGDSAV